MLKTRFFITSENFSPWLIVLDACTQLRMRQIDADLDMASQIATIYFNVFEYILHIFLHD